MVDQPGLTPTQLANGPDFNAADPEKSRFVYFTAADNIFCYFRPSDPQTCDLRATLDGDKQVLKETQDLMIQRLGRLDPQTVRAIFTEAGSRRWTPKQLRRLRDSGSRNLKRRPSTNGRILFSSGFGKSRARQTARPTRAAKRMLNTCTLVIRSDG